MAKEIHIHIGGKRTKDASFQINLSKDDLQRALNKSYKGMQILSSGSAQIKTAKFSVKLKIKDDLGETSESTLYGEIQNGNIVDLDF